jgi:hypothetical protein
VRRGAGGCIQRIERRAHRRRELRFFSDDHAARERDDASNRSHRRGPSSAAGELSGAYLSSGDMHTSALAYRYKDYMADVSATKIPQAGVAVREHYMSARD